MKSPSGARTVPTTLSDTPASPAPRGPGDRAELDGPLAPIPPLGLLAALAAFAALAIDRVLVPGLEGTVSDATRVALGRWGDLSRNLAAIAGMVALTAALFAFLRYPRYAPLRRRLSLAALAGILLPTIALSTFMGSSERTTAVFILLGVAAANLLVLLVGLTALLWPAPLGIRIGTGLAATASLLGFGSLALYLFVRAGRWEIGYGMGATLMLMRQGGELAYLLVPFAAGGTIVLVQHGLRHKVALGVGGAMVLAVAITMFVARGALRGGFAVVLYGAQHVGLPLDTAPLVYALPLAVGLGIAVAALLSDQGSLRQAGAGLLLWMSAGNTPTTSGQLLTMALGATLLARSAIALSERRVGRAPKRAVAPGPTATQGAANAPAASAQTTARTVDEGAPDATTDGAQTTDEGAPDATTDSAQTTDDGAPDATTDDAQTTDDGAADDGSGAPAQEPEVR